MKHLAALVVCTAFVVACSDRPTTPPPPSTTPPGDNTITGSERIGWDQTATSASELATFRYAIYVDGTRSELTSVTCGSGSTSFTCSARLPQMSRGSHSLELATFVVDGGIIESAKAGPLMVMVTGGISVAAAASAPDASDETIPVRAGDVTIGDEIVALDAVADGPSRPTDLVMTPDGRLLIADRTGAVRVVLDGQLLDMPALALDAARGDGPILALDLDPDFARTHLVYTISTEYRRSGEPTFIVARYREAGNTLGDRVVLLDGVAATADNATAGLRFGPDGKLYVVFDDGGDPSRGVDPASYNSKVLRLNPDGTTPSDQRALSPVFASAFRVPKGIGWTTSGVLWLLDGREPSPAAISMIRSGEPRTFAIAGSVNALADASDAAGLAVYRDGPIAALRDNLLVAGGADRHLLRLRIDAKEPTRFAGTERLLADRIGPLRAVTVGSDGAVYLAIDGAIARLRSKE
jgi:glucose/arabinose dehydrogenase